MNEANPAATPSRLPLPSLAASFAALLASSQGLGADAREAGGYAPQVDAGTEGDKPWLPEGFTLSSNASSGELELSHTSHRSHASHASHASGSSPSLPRPRAPSAPYSPSAPSSPSPSPAAPAKAPSPSPSQLQQPVTTNTILEALAKTHKHDILLEAIKLAGLDTQLQSAGSMTLIAPTDDAFRQLSTAQWDAICKPGRKEDLAKLLKVHVLDMPLTTTNLKTAKTAKTLEGRELAVETVGNKVTVGSARLLDGEQQCSNGVLLQTDRVLLNAAGNLMTVMETRGYATMAGLFRAAGMESMLWQPMPYTVLVPSEEAFKKLPAGTLERLRKPENLEELKTLLNHHLIRGRCTAKSLIDAKTTRLNDDSQLTVASVSGLAEIGGVLVSMPDDEASNGYLHRIDAVLIPKP